MTFKTIDEDKDFDEWVAGDRGYGKIKQFGNISSKQDLLECTKMLNLSCW